jgi:hypothetical protein
MSTITITPEVNGLKARLKDTWMAGDYDRFSRSGFIRYPEVIAVKA